MEAAVNTNVVNKNITEVAKQCKLPKHTKPQKLNKKKQLLENRSLIPETNRKAVVYAEVNKIVRMYKTKLMQKVVERYNEPPIF